MSQLPIPDLNRHLDELEDLAFTIIPGYLDGRITAEIRRYIDTLIASGLPVVQSNLVDTDKPRLLRNENAESPSSDIPWPATCSRESPMILEPSN